MLAVTGATGFLGFNILDQILIRSLLPASKLVAICRDPTSDKLKPLVDKGITARQGDFADPSSIENALKGIETLCIVSPAAFGEEAMRLTGNAIEAAKASGVQKVYYTSQAAAKEHSKFAPAPIHWIAEQHLSRSGLEWVSMRNGFYMSSLLNLIGEPVKSGNITFPPDGKVAWVDRLDLAKANAEIITGNYDTNGQNVIELVNSNSWDMADAAKIISKVTSKVVERVIVSRDEYAEILKSSFIPAQFQPLLVDTAECMTKGEWAMTSRQTEQIIGEECKFLEAFLGETYGQTGK